MLKLKALDAFYKIQAESVDAIVSSNVSDKTDFVIIGKKPEAKYQKALELDIKI